MRYDYRAMSCEGRESKGFVDAKSEVEANVMIKERGLFPISIKKSDSELVKAVDEDYGKDKSDKRILLYVGIAYVLGIFTGIAICFYRC